MSSSDEYATGYVAPSYAASLAEFGTPHLLPRSGGWVLRRPVPGGSDDDAMGCYPLFCCRDWSGLAEDVSALREDVVALSLVADPFGRYSPVELERCFPGRVTPFKEHFTVDLALPVHDRTVTHHRRNARRALRTVAVEASPDPSSLLGEWTGLYSNLTRRHGIRGLPAFSERAFAGQLQVPGIVAFRAVHEAATVGISLWYIQGRVAYYHLGAYSDAGYELGASFAMIWRAIEHLASVGLEWLNLGAGAGLRDDPGDGLARFKRGWATGRRTAYFCGAVLAPERYEAIVTESGRGPTSYFPAYRAGEFSG